MAYLDRADLIRRLKVRLGRPTSDNAFTVTTADDVYDDCLTEAQDHLNKMLAIFVPDAVWPIPTQLTSADGGKTWTFGTDTDSAAIFAFGHFQVFEQLEDIPNMPMTEGVDFRVEGSLLRIPDNNSRVFSAGPYAQFASPSNVINATHEPVVPKITRMPLLSEAEVRCWRVLGMDTAGAEAEAKRDWETVLMAIKTQSVGKGGQPILRRPRSYLLRGRR